MEKAKDRGEQKVMVDSALDEIVRDILRRCIIVERATNLGSILYVTILRRCGSFIHLPGLPIFPALGDHVGHVVLAVAAVVSNTAVHHLLKWDEICSAHYCQINLCHISDQGKQGSRG